MIADVVRDHLAQHKDRLRTMERDELAVELFEAFIHSQTPAAQPWAPVTDYSFEARKQIEGIHPQLIKEVFQPTNVLDVGCGPEAILVRLLRGLGVTAAGCDPQITKPHARYVFHADVVDGSIHRRTHDLVICREVLEHLTVKEIRQAVRNLVRLSSKYVYVTTRFCCSPMHLLSVEDHDDLDPTHITMLSKPFLRTLFILEGCTSRPDLELRMDHQHKGRCLVFEVA